MAQELNPHLDFSDIREGMGAPPVMVDEARLCDDCRKVHEFEKCPKCGSWIDIGFGLQFGGFGPYKFCQNDSCDWFYKEQVEE
jgi:hypothetical protein